MKKIFTLCLLLVTSLLLFGQKATLYSETFDEPNLPEGWHLSNQAYNYYHEFEISESNFAGGEENELAFGMFSPLRTFNNNDKVRIISPVINMEGVENLALQFLYFIRVKPESVSKIGIETRSNDAATWNLAWEFETPTVYINGQYSVLTGILTPDIGEENFQFCIFIELIAPQPYISLFVDNIELFSMDEFNADVSVQNDIYTLTGDYAPELTITNTGYSTISSLEMKYQYNDLPAITQAFNSINIEPLKEQTFVFEELTNLTPNTYLLEVEVLKVNETTVNVKDEKTIYVASQEAERKVCIELFTSSTCDPCLGANFYLRSLLPAYKGKYSITKYQMNRPVSLQYPFGDPYYTKESEVRSDYFDVNTPYLDITLPHILFNATEASPFQADLEQALLLPAYADLFGGFVVNEDFTVNVCVTLQSFIDIPEAQLYVIVNEKKTTGNITSNGETEFFNVMMKMIPDAHGTTINIGIDEIEHFYFDCNLKSTNIEEYDDLEVHVFLQVIDSKYVFNSNFLQEGTTIPNAPASLVAVQDNTSVILTWTDTNSDSDSYIVYFNNQVIELDVSETTYTHEDVPEGLHTYGVAAVTKGYVSEPIETQIEVNYIGIDSFNDIIKVYPNPANNSVYVEGVDLKSIGIYNNMSRLVKVKKVKHNDIITQINIHDLSSGIYFLQITNKSDELFIKKIVVTK